MYTYKVRPMQRSARHIIEFDGDPADAALRAAIAAALEPHGFIVRYDGDYIDARHPDASSPFHLLSVCSDQWGIIWGDGDPWGEVANNHEHVARLDALLQMSGLFSKHP
jgi:hypothetical protein